MAVINSILVVGGGSSGWMTAATLINSFPEKSITVIESPNIPTVGVGESTIGQINSWLNMLDIKDDDWMKECDASYKMSIKFTNFYQEGDGGFHYPFGDPWFHGTAFGADDWFIKKLKYPETPVTDFANSFHPQMALVNKNKISDNANKEFPGYRFDNDVAYHFDAAKFGAWLRDKYSVPKGVKVIKSEVVSVATDDSGVQSLTLTDGSIVSADLYIDCTGWKALLIDKALNVPFKSYSDILPNDSAWATRMPYKNKAEEIEPFTNCTAIHNGWVWNIPLWSRIGTGYVYSSKFISDEDALKEFKNYLVNERTVKIDQEIVDSLEFKNIKMRVGLHEKIWTKNVCAIGLSAGFIEPLESNGLYTVHEFLKQLVNTLRRGNITGFDRATFNETCKGDFRSFAEFVALHYILSKRKDTTSNYWSSTQDREDWKIDARDGVYCLYGIEEFMYKLGHNKEFSRDMGGIVPVSVGMRINPITKEHLKKNEFLKDLSFDFVEDSFEIMKNNQELWSDTADKCPSLYEFLRAKYGTD